MLFPLLLPWTYLDLSLAPGPEPAAAQAAPMSVPFPALSPDVRAILSRASLPPGDAGPPVSPHADFQSLPLRGEGRDPECGCGGSGCTCAHPGACDVSRGACIPGLHGPGPIRLDEPTTVVVPPPAPAKRWVWLTGQRCWGYGFQRSDGLWVIDPGSKRYPAAPAPTPVRWYYAPSSGCADGSCYRR